MKELFLFNPDRYLKRKTANETEFNEELEKFLPDFFYAFEYAFEKMIEQRSKLKTNEINARWYAEAINRYAFSWLIENINIAPYIRKRHGTFYFEKGEYRLTFKKVNNRFKPSYNPTRQSRLLERNLSLTDSDLQSIVFIGYQVDSTWSKLLKVHAISRSANSINWVTNLEEKATASDNATVHAIKQLFVEKDSVLEPEVKLKRKKKHRKNKVI